MVLTEPDLLLLLLHGGYCMDHGVLVLVLVVWLWWSGLSGEL